jgi:hypothetical protein
MNAIATLGSLEAPGLRRVRKEEVVKSAFSKPDGLEFCLACWKDWMAGTQNKDLEIKGGTIYQDGASEPILDENGKPIPVPPPDMYEQQQEADNRVAMATDAMINSLGRLHVWAIYRSCSIASVWRFPNADFLVAAEEARNELKKKLSRNVCTATLF